MPICRSGNEVLSTASKSTFTPSRFFACMAAITLLIRTWRALVASTMLIDASLKSLIVTTTFVPARCALLMRLVISALCQPLKRFPDCADVPSGCTTAKAGDLSDVLSPFEPAGDTPHAVAANATTATMANLVVLDIAGSLCPTGPVNATCDPRDVE